MSRRCRVAVIGAGAAGLVAARELLREGHSAVVFERANRVGGVWAYDPRVESDPLGLDPSRAVVHSSLYRSLRTNLPRQLMGFPDCPFPGAAGCYGDPRSFPSHEEVLRFLEEFARETGPNEAIRFGVEVVKVRPPPVADGGWVVEWREVASGTVSSEMFEAVVVCSGHYSQPRLPKIPGSNVVPLLPEL